MFWYCTKLLVLIEFALVEVVLIFRKIIDVVRMLKSSIVGAKGWAMMTIGSYIIRTIAMRPNIIVIDRRYHIVMRCLCIMLFVIIIL